MDKYRLPRKTKKRLKSGKASIYEVCKAHRVFFDGIETKKEYDVLDVILEQIKNAR
jgi:hypothetical protein